MKKTCFHQQTVQFIKRGIVFQITLFLTFFTNFATYSQQSSQNIDVAWKEKVGVIQNQNSELEKIDPDGWGNGGAKSLCVLESMKNGWIELFPGNTASDFATGFHDITGPDCGDFHVCHFTHGILFTSTQSFEIIEGGILTGKTGMVNATDKFKIERTGGRMRYFRNNQLLHQTITKMQEILRVEVSIFNHGGIVKIIQSSFSCPLVVDAGTDKTICNGGSTTLGGTPVASAGTPPYTYLWEPNYALSNTTTAHPIANPSITTQYILLVTDNAGNQAKDQILVTVDNVSGINAGLDVMICPGASTTLTAIGANKYTWYPSSGLNTTDGAIVIASPTSTTTYTVTGITKAGCIGTDDVVVNVDVPPVAKASGNVTLNPGQRAYIGSLPVAGNAYRWSPTVGLFSPNRAYSIVEPLLTTNYILTVTDQFGCKISDTVNVRVKNPYQGPSDTIITCGYDPREVVDINSKDNRLAIPEDVRFYLENNSASRESRNCGNRFRLHFDDDLLWAGKGFDDGTYGANRKQCACNVFQYIETVLDIPPGDGSRIDIVFGASNDSMVAQVLGKSAPLYDTNFANNIPGIYPCLAFEHITSGNDPDTVQMDGLIWINFELSNIGPKCDKVTCRTDLFSTILHEATHALGWASLITEDSTQIPTSVTDTNQFSLYDKMFLFYSTSISGPFNQIIDPASINTNPQINSFFSISPFPKPPLQSDKIWLYNDNTKTNQPIYSRPGFAFGASLSHFDARYMLGRNHDSPGFVPNYVMTSDVASWQLKREYTMQELRALQTLGYTIRDTTNLGNHPPYVDGPVITPNYFGPNAYNETLFGINPALVLDSISNCDSSVVDLGTLSAFHDIDGNSIKIDSGSLFNIRGCGIGSNNHNALTIIPGGGTNGSDKIIYNPRDNFIGLAQFGFHLYDGKEKGSFVVLSINVKKGTCFHTNPPDSPDELVINGTFEEGSEVTTKANPNFQRNVNWGVYFIGGEGINFFGSTRWNWPHADGMFLMERTVDLYIRDSWVDCEYGMTSLSFPSLDNPTSVDSSNRFIGFTSSEPTYVQLAEYIQPCNRYKLSFDVRRRPLGSNVVINLAFQFVEKFGNNSETVTSVNNAENGGNWEHVNNVFVYKNGLDSMNMMKIQPSTQMGADYVILDNLSLILDTTYKPVEAHAGTDTIVCSGTRIGDVSTATNGTPGYTYSWSPSTGLGSTTISNPIVTATIVTTTTYTVTVTDASMCTAIDSVTITINPRPVATIDSITNIICNDSLSAKNGIISIDISGGIPPYSYQWNTNPIQTTIIATGLGAGNYIVIVTDSNACTDTLKAEIKKTAFSKPKIKYNGPDTVCGGTTTTIIASPYFSYNKNRWSTGAKTDRIFPYLVSGDYSFYFTSEDTNGCIGTSDTVKINVLPIGQIGMGFTGSVLCPGLSLTFSVFPDFDHYLWSNGDTTKSTSITSAGIYSVTVTNDNGCSKSISTTPIISVPNCDSLPPDSLPPYDPNNKIVSPTGCGKKGIIENQKFTYSINFQNIGSGPAKDVVLHDIIDSDLIIDSLNVISSSHTISNFSIDQNSRLLSVLFENIFLPPMMYELENSIGEITYSIVPIPNLPNGTEISNETAIVFDQNEPIITNKTINTIVDDVNIYVEAGADKTVYLGYQPNECTTMDASASGGLPPYSYHWSNGDSSQTSNVCPIQTTKYYVTATYSDGCPIAADSVAVKVIDIRCGDNKEKVLMCHILKENPSNPQTICVDADAVQTHLDNGDYLGKCIQTALRKTSLAPEDISESESISVNPNPVSNLINFKILLAYSSKIKIELYDTKGRRITAIFKGDLEKNKEISFLYDIGYINENILLCKIITDKNVFNYKLIKTN